MGPGSGRSQSGGRAVGTGVLGPSATRTRSAYSKQAVKTLTVIVGALLGIAVSAVVLSFQAALSPFFAFLVLAGVALWLRDVRRSPTGSSGPNWRSFFLGAACWVGLAIGAVLFKSWLESVPPGAASPSVIGACMVAFGIAFVAIGIYGFRGHPSKRVIENWARLDDYMPIFGMFSAALPLGIAMVILGALVLFKPPDMFAQWILIPFVGLTLAAIVLMIWQPQAARPPWLRDYQRDARSDDADAPLTGH